LRVTSLGANWRRLWVAGAVSSLGDGAYAAAIPLLAVAFTAQPAQVAGVSTATFLPWLLFSLHAGVLADRYDRRRLMWMAQAVQAGAVAAAALVATLPGGRIWMLYVTSFVLGAAETVFGNCSQTVLPAIVGREHLETANGRQYASQTVAEQFVGPPLGSLLFAAALPATRSLPFWLDALSFAVSAVLIARIRLSRPADKPGPAPARRPMRQDIAEGLRWLGRHRLLRTLALLLAVTNLAGQLGYSTFVLFARDELHVGARGYGVLLTATAVGGVLGGVASRRIVARLGTRRAILLGSGLGTAAAAAVGLLAHNAAVMVVCMALSAFAGTQWNVATVSLRQRIIPDRIQGRVNSVYRLAGWGALPIGATLGGVIASSAGLRAPWYIAAALRLGVLTVALVSLRPSVFAYAQARTGEEAAGAPEPVLAE
jgi:MFS family permease